MSCNNSNDHLALLSGCESEQVTNAAALLHWCQQIQVARLRLYTEQPFGNVPPSQPLPLPPFAHQGTLELALKDDLSAGWCCQVSTVDTNIV